jgi:hypothetical protein
MAMGPNRKVLPKTGILIKTERVRENSPMRHLLVIRWNSIWDRCDSVLNIVYLHRFIGLRHLKVGLFSSLGGKGRVHQMSVLPYFHLKMKTEFSKYCSVINLRLWRMSRTPVKPIFSIPSEYLEAT